VKFHVQALSARRANGSRHFRFHAGLKGKKREFWQFFEQKHALIDPKLPKHTA
jgi:hypothetical protein